MKRLPLVVLSLVIGLFVSSTRVLAVDGGKDRPFDRLHDALAPYLDHAKNDLAFEMKARSLVSNPYKFWRGSKDLYFAWCKVNASDWLSDRDAYVASHGDLHFGNIGTYATNRKLGDVAFGLVDFDDSAILPFQLSLLDGAITLRLVAVEGKIELDDAEVDKVMAAMLESYQAALAGRTTATIAPAVAKMVDGTDVVPYQREIEAFTNGNGAFRAGIRNKNGKLVETMNPAMDRADEIAVALAEIVRRSPEARRTFRLRSTEEFRKAIRDVAMRTRFNSSGSQGQTKLVVLLREGAMRDIEGDAIIYFKEQIPTAAERSGAIPRDARPPGQRCSDITARLTAPSPYLNEWCGMGTQSFVVQLKEPWGNELDTANVKSRNDLIRYARIWGDVAGHAHRIAGLKPAIVESQMMGGLNQKLTERSNQYVIRLLKDLEDFRTDPRAIGLVRAADRAVEQFESSR